MSSVVVCGLMCSIINCFFCLGAYLTENPHDNHVNYVRYRSTDFVLESTLQRTEKQLLLQQQSILPSKDLCNHVNYVRYRSTGFFIESTLQRTEKQLLLQQQSILPNKDWCNQTHFSHYLRLKKRTFYLATTSVYLFVTRSATLCHRPGHLSIFFFLWNLVSEYFNTDVSSKMS